MTLSKLIPSIVFEHTFNVIDSMDHCAFIIRHKRREQSCSVKFVDCAVPREVSPIHKRSNERNLEQTVEFHFLICIDRLKSGFHDPCLKHKPLIDHKCNVKRYDNFFDGFFYFAVVCYHFDKDLLSDLVVPFGQGHRDSCILSATQAQEPRRDRDHDLLPVW